MKLPIPSSNQSSHLISGWEGGCIKSFREDVKNTFLKVSFALKFCQYQL